MAKTLLRIMIGHDCDVENPCEYDGWKLYSFSRDHKSFRHPDDIKGQYGIGLHSKLRVGTAFMLGYFEHSGCEWSLSGEQWQCPWDSVNNAGILIWEGKRSDLGPKTHDARQEDARRFLETYTDWCNGECYWYQVDKVEVPDDWDGDPEDDIVRSAWEDVGGCGGYIGEKWLTDEIRETIKDEVASGAEIAIVEGEGKWIADCHDFAEPVKVESIGQ